MFVQSLVFPFFLSLSAVRSSFAANAEEWRSRSIYQVMTDRFARTDGSTTAACDSSSTSYCGGSWKGIESKLDYIQGMNFTAIWISPTIEQITGDTYEGEAYHGYWPKNYYNVNSNFGSSSDLQDLVNAAHVRGMYVMVDIVVNHFANWGDSDIDWSGLTPLNSESYFHPKCWVDWNNQTSAEQCWMGDGYVPLMDVNTEDDQVITMLNNFVHNLTTTYGFDGTRLDAAKSIRKDFWPAFVSAAGVYSQGEAWYGDAPTQCAYQDYMDGVHNYVMKTFATEAISGQGNMTMLAGKLNGLVSTCKDVSLLGSFMENHDNARMASISSDTAILKTAAALTVLSGNGIPIVFYGQEQMSSGNNAPQNRQALWLTGYPTGSDKLYTYFATLNTFRNHIGTSDSAFLTAKPTYDAPLSTVLSVRKGNMMMFISNEGSKTSSTKLTSTGWSANTALVDVLSCQSVSSDGSGNAAVNMNGGLPVAMYPKSYLTGSGLCSL
ncbi:glycoside hydrolase family 13 protein [Lentinula aciculospora]|uniref:alpha-amylase n=1 Tax=Lentinula aciculospora TaxID=153920 RepID=A0A9W9AJ19_9AGAR|nr:glycoside hydrolase family 13 protein [Lentinula aciculospora]